MRQIAHATPVGRHAVVIIVGAGWYTYDTAAEFKNLTLINLLPYSLELNPIEQVWSWVRQHCLSDQVLSGYEEIVNEVSKAWNHFISVPERVKKMCNRKWIKLTYSLCGIV